MYQRRRGLAESAVNGDCERDGGHAEDAGIVETAETLEMLDGAR